MSREIDLISRPEELRFSGFRLMLYREVWGEIRPLRLCFIVELLRADGYPPEYKAAFDTIEEADADFLRVKKKYAREIAMVALGINRRL
jgi:hypothetical protein